MTRPQADPNRTDHASPAPGAWHGNGAARRAAERAEAAFEDGVGRLADWLAIASVGTDPAHDAETRRAAAWCRDHLAGSGFEAELIPTGTDDKPGHPAVIAHTPGDPAYRGPHVLFYGHYDVQPADPVELWDTPPFEPRLAGEGEDRRLIARGASDDKGQVAMYLEAVRAWHEETGAAAGGVRTTVLIEGEEESGSVNLPALIERERARFEACDVCVISDTAMLARGRPAITYGVRGLTYIEATLHGPDHDLHSGVWGGGVPNPLNELVKILGGLWDDTRRVTIPGFYDGVRGPGAGELADWDRLGVDEAALLGSVGLPPEGGVGEAGHGLLARTWARPACDLNGVVGGYTGAGAKTVIPAKATAKLSFRLVDDQDPDAVRDAAFEWFRRRTPPGCRWTFTDHGGGLGATLSTEAAPLRAAARAIETACGVAPALIRSGGSIPVAGLLKQRLGLETVFMGFGLDDDRIHSPNEKFELACYRQGLLSHVALIGELWKLGAA